MSERCRRCDRDGCEWPRVQAMEWEEYDEQDPAWLLAVDDGCEPNAVDWRARALAAEARITDADRTALATAAFELKERRGTYETQLSQFRASGSNPAVIETWEAAVEGVNKAIEAIERMSRG